MKYNIFERPILRKAHPEIKVEYSIIHNYCKELAIAKTINAHSAAVNYMELLNTALHRWNLRHHTKLSYYTVGGGVVLNNTKGGEIRYVGNYKDDID